MNPTTAPTKNAKGRITGRQFEPKPVMVVPEHVNAPKPVLKAAAKARAAVAAYKQASAEVKEAEAAVKAAPLLDQRADAEAVAKGAADMPERTEPARRAELATALRLETARRTAAVAALTEQGDAITDNYEAFMDSLRAERRETQERVNEIAGELRTLFRRLRATGNAIDALTHFNGFAPTFSLREPDSPEREAKADERAAARMEKTLDSGQRNLVRYEYRTLIAALERLAEEGAAA